MKKLINLAGLQFFLIFKFKSQFTPFQPVVYFEWGLKASEFENTTKFYIMARKNQLWLRKLTLSFARILWSNFNYNTCILVVKRLLFVERNLP